MGVSQVGGTSYNRLVTKQNAAGSALLNPSGTTVSSATGVVSLGTYGSYAQVTAATGADLLISAVAARATGSVSGQVVLYVDVAIGGAGSETVVNTSVIATESAGGAHSGSVNLPVPVRVAAGTRVAVRISIGNTAAGTALPINIWVMAAPYANVEGN